MFQRNPNKLSLGLIIELKCNLLINDGTVLNTKKQNGHIVSPE